MSSPESTGFEAYKLYTSLHLHFTGTYDYVKYNGKSNASPTTFMKRKDKYQFYKLSRKYNLEELKDFLIANFLDYPKKWAGDLLQPEAEDVYKAWLKTRQSITYIFQNDLEYLFDKVKYTPEELLKVKGGDYPILLNETMHKDITLETLVMMNDILGFLPMWDKKISDTYIWPDWSMKIKKYTPFLVYDKDKTKKILKEKIQDINYNNLNK